MNVFLHTGTREEQSFAVASSAVSKPGGDAAGQDALHSAGVEGSEDAGARSKLPQPSQEEEALMCLLQHCVFVSRPCEILGDVNAVRCTSVEDQRRRGVVAHSDHLTSACQEVQDPAAQRSVQSQSLELRNQCGRHYGVKW